MSPSPSKMEAWKWVTGISHCQCLQCLLQKPSKMQKALQSLPCQSPAIAGTQGRSPQDAMIPEQEPSSCNRKLAKSNKTSLGHHVEPEQRQWPIRTDLDQDSLSTHASSLLRISLYWNSSLCEFPEDRLGVTVPLYLLLVPICTPIKCPFSALYCNSSL